MSGESPQKDLPGKARKGRQKPRETRPHTRISGYERFQLGPGESRQHVQEHMVGARKAKPLLLHHHHLIRRLVGHVVIYGGTPVRSPEESDGQPRAPQVRHQIAERPGSRSVSMR